MATLLYTCAALSVVLLEAVGSDTVNYAQFQPRVTKGTVYDDNVDESSGLAVSRLHTDVVYTHNDKGGLNRLFAIDVTTGTVVATITINNVTNYDWEDLAYGPCAGDCDEFGICRGSSYCIYISETGDHGGSGSLNNIYMIREPKVMQDTSVDVVDTLKFRWTEEDCETLMIAPNSQLYVVSKVKGGRAMIAQLPSSAWGGDRVTLNMAHTGILKVTTDHHDPQGGDISPSGTEMLLVFEDDVMYYSVPDGDFIKAVNNQLPQNLTETVYTRVPSCEAIAWTPQGPTEGFYTISEGTNQTIYFYRKNNQNQVVGR